VTTASTGTPLCAPDSSSTESSSRPAATACRSIVIHPGSSHQPDSRSHTTLAVPRPAPTPPSSTSRSKSPVPRRASRPGATTSCHPTVRSPATAHLPCMKTDPRRTGPPGADRPRHRRTRSIPQPGRGCPAVSHTPHPEAQTAPATTAGMVDPPRSRPRLPRSATLDARCRLFIPAPPPFAARWIEPAPVYLGCRPAPSFFRVLTRRIRVGFLIRPEKQGSHAECAQTCPPRVPRRGNRGPWSTGCIRVFPGSGA
jgi:hypothetical protein